jgi:transcriptional regulator with XRE-family HTH domain
MSKAKVKTIFVEDKPVVYRRESDGCSQLTFFNYSGGVSLSLYSDYPSGKIPTKDIKDLEAVANLLQQMIDDAYAHNDKVD